MNKHEPALTVARPDRRVRRSNRGGIWDPLTDVADLRLMCLHGVKGNTLDRFGADSKLGRINVWQEAVRNPYKLPRRRDQYNPGDAHDCEPVAKRPLQRAIVTFQQTVKKSLHGRVHPPVFHSVLRAQEAAAKHGSQCQRDEARHQNRGHDHHGKFVQEPADDPTHEKHRNKDGYERHGHRKNREADFPRPFHRRVHHALAQLHVPHDVFEHHDRIVNDEANRKRQGHQRQIVDRVIQLIHHRKRTHDGHGQRDTWNQSRGDIAQKEKDHQNYENNCEKQRELYVVDRAANGQRSVV